MALKSKGGIDVEYTEEGEMIVTKHGAMVKDDLRNPVDAQTFIYDSLKSLDLIVKPGGKSNGDGDDTGNGSENSYDKFVKQMVANDIKEGSIEFNEKMQAALKDGTLKL